MSSPEEKNYCHLCECPSHAEEFETRKIRMEEEVWLNNPDSLKTLFDFSTWYNNNDQCRSSLSQTAILHSCCEIHEVTKLNPDFLHQASDVFNFETVHFLVEKGFDVNKQDFEFEMFFAPGETALHKCCRDIQHDYDRRKMVEVVSMLLWYGADPMIEKCTGRTAFEMFIYHCDPIMIAIQEHLFCYTFDRYSERIDAEAFLIALHRLDLRIFYELTKTSTEKPVFNDRFQCMKNLSRLFTMKSNSLQFLIDNFDYVVKEMFQMTSVYNFARCETPILFENFEILLKSKLKQEFTDWLSNAEMRNAIGYILSSTDAYFSAEKIVCLLLSYGVKLYEFDLRCLYEKYGHCELFKILLYMDVEKDTCFSESRVMPKILYDISLDVPKMIRDHRFSKANLRELSPYFTIPSYLLLDSDWEDAEKGPRVPLLIELARDAFRKYFIERFAIKNARQFYTLVKLLPISRYHQAIITLEAKLHD